jgi:hypothetical protein
MLNKQTNNIEDDVGDAISSTTTNIVFKKTEARGHSIFRVFEMVQI